MALAFCQCYKRYSPAGGRTSVPVPPSRVQTVAQPGCATPVLAAVFPTISDTTRLDDGKQGSKKEVFQTDNAEP